MPTPAGNAGCVFMQDIDMGKLTYWHLDNLAINITHHEAQDIELSVELMLAELFCIFFALFVLAWLCKPNYKPATYRPGFHHDRADYIDAPVHHW